jgi:3-oxoacyl-[acyl-carrier-protein] synthase-3
MSFLNIENIRIDAIAADVPENIFKNEDIDFLSQSEREILIESIGINERRYVSKGVTASDLCFNAAQKIFEQKPELKSEIKVLIFVSQTPDYFTPASAVVLQNRLGLSTEVIAFDINLGCSGYVYGLSVIASLLSSLKKGKGLLLVGDTSSSFVSDKDKSVLPLFSDAGTATLLSYQPGVEPMFFHLGSDGSGYEAIIVSGGGRRNPYHSKSFEVNKYENQIERNELQMKLDGMQIMHFSLKEVPKSVRAALEFAKISQDEIDFFYFHQANKIINQSLMKKLKISPEKYPETLSRYGNTSSATIPLTIIENIHQHNQSTLNLLCGFGVGLSWATALIKLDELAKY